LRFRAPYDGRSHRQAKEDQQPTGARHAPGDVAGTEEPRPHREMKPIEAKDNILF
jgi:hypothetical protein